MDKCKKTVDTHQAYGALRTDLPKLFHYLNHDLLIAKLHSCGISLSSLMNDFLICSLTIVHLSRHFTAAY